MDNPYLKLKYRENIMSEKITTDKKDTRLSLDEVDPSKARRILSTCKTKDGGSPR